MHSISHTHTLHSTQTPPLHLQPNMYPYILLLYLSILCCVGIIHARNMVSTPGMCIARARVVIVTNTHTVNDDDDNTHMQTGHAEDAHANQQISQVVDTHTNQYKARRPVLCRLSCARSFGDGTHSTRHISAISNYVCTVYTCVSVCVCLCVSLRCVERMSAMKH